jgi:integrase
VGRCELDRDRPRLHVRRSITESGVFQKPKTPGSVRKIPIGPVLLSALREHRMRSRFKDENDLIFPNTSGGPLDGHNTVSRHFRPTLKKAGLRKFAFMISGIRP